MTAHIRRSLRVFAVLLLGSTMITSASFAANQAAAVGPAKSNASNTMMDKRLMVSKDGFQAVRDVGEARIAIFEGNIDGAKKLVTEAQTALTTVTTQAPKDFPNGAGMNGNAGNPDVIPIDARMIVADNMVMTPDKTAKVKEANEHLKNGETDKAMDTLKQGAIDVAFTRVLMPVKETKAHVDSAETLMSQGKYYEANLALKAANDLLRTDTTAFAETAAQASKDSGVPAIGSAGTPTSTASSTPAAPTASTNAPNKK